MVALRAAAAWPAALAGLVWAVACAGCGGGLPPQPCHVDGECPIHQLCGGGACETGCLTDAECGEGRVCSPHGRCVDAANPGARDLGLADASVEFDADVTDFGADASPFDANAPDAGADAGVCGDGKIDPGESCDDGAGNSDDPAAAATCTTRCHRRASCGAISGADAARIDPESGHCYVAWPGPLDWTSALEACRERGGSLVSVDSADEEVLVEAVSGTVPRWLGLTSPVVRCLNGQPVGYQHFAAGEPNGDGDCVELAPASGWKDVACGWPGSGLLPSSPASTAGFVCESGCGNGVAEPGEECDPPAAGACTATCQRIRSCPEGMTSPATGHCYFTVVTAKDYAGALAGCPAGTHLATLEAPSETAIAEQVIGGDAWIALRAATSADQFAWDVGNDAFASKRYHGFVSGEPNGNGVPDCVRVTATGWKDMTCTSQYAFLCERE